MPKWCPKASQNRAQEPSKTLLEPVCRWKPFWPPCWSIFGPKNRALAVARCHFFKNCLSRPGLQNQAQKAPKIEAKSLPGGFKMAAKRVSKKASILDTILKLLLSILEGGGASKWLPKSLQKRPWLQRSVFPTPGSPPGAHFDPSGLDFGVSGS